MIIQCNSCSTKFRLDDARVSSTGVKVRCTKCQNVFIVWPPEHPGGAEGQAPDAPSQVAPEEGSAEETPAGDEQDSGDSAEERQVETGEEGPVEDERDKEAGAAEDESEEGDEGEGSAPDLSFGDVDLSFIKKDAEGTVDEEAGQEQEGPGPDSLESERNEWREALEGTEPEATEEAEERDELLKALNEALVQADVGPAGEAPEGTDTELDLSFDEGPGEEAPEIGPEELGISTGDSDGQEAGEEAVREPLKEDAPEEVALEAEEPFEAEAAPDKEVPYEEAPSARVEEEEGEGPDLTQDEPAEAAPPDIEAAPPVEAPEEAEEQPQPEGQTQGEKTEEFVFTAAPRGTNEAGFDELLAKELGEDAPEEHPEGADEEAPFAAPPAEPRSMGLGLVIVALIIIAGGAIIYSSGIIDKLTGSIVPGSSPTQKTVAIQNIDGYVAENDNFGRLLVIEAKIRNIMSEPQELSGVRGTLYSSSGKKLAERTVSPGRVVSQEDLRNLSRADLQKPFRDASGGTLPPRGTVPVMVLFEEIPEGTAEFGIEVLR